jgi:hypothetical protein
VLDKAYKALSNTRKKEFAVAAFSAFAEENGFKPENYSARCGEICGPIIIGPIIIGP